MWKRSSRILAKNIKLILYRHLRVYLDAHKQTPAVQVITSLNPVIRGWANYYRHSAAKDVFSKVRHAQWQMLWNWAKRRHPNKSSQWVKARYFRDDGYWTFQEEEAELVKPDKTPITRYTKVTGPQVFCLYISIGYNITLSTAIVNLERFI